MSTSDETPSDLAKRRKTRHAVEVVPDAESLASRAAEWLIGQIAHAVARRGRAAIALSGGSTPRALYELLAQHPWRDRIQWNLLHVFWGDERFVAADDPASNVRMVREVLLDRVEIPASHVYAVALDANAPNADDTDAAFERARAAAALYETTLHAFYGGTRLDDTRPFFDVVLLGLGEDGHTASLFPGSKALDEREHWVAAVKTRGDGKTSTTAPIRITLTYPILESTHAVAFLVAGVGKREIARRVLDGDETLPAARVHAIGGTLWIMDEAAATPNHSARERR